MNYRDLVGFLREKKKRVDKLGWHVNFDTGFDEKKIIFA